MNIYRFEELGHANHGWLDTRHHFSFANYFNPKRMGFGKLRVINDDIIKAGAGFPPHPHQNMEIITYVRKGAITHRDSNGNEGRTEAGNVQVMSAGTGIFHSEYNLESEDTQIFQIWIEPKKINIKPSWDAHEFPQNETKNTLKLLVAGDDSAPLKINQDAKIFAGKIVKDNYVSHNINQQSYFLVSEGEVDIAGETLKKGDGAEITSLGKVTITAKKDSEVLLLEVPN